MVKHLFEQIGFDHNTHIMHIVPFNVVKCTILFNLQRCALNGHKKKAKKLRSMMVWFPERRFEKVVLDSVIFFFKSNIVSYQFKYLSISLSINLNIS